MKKILILSFVIIIICFISFNFSKYTTKTVFDYNPNVPTGFSYTRGEDTIPSSNVSAGWFELEKSFATPIKFPPYGYSCKNGEQAQKIHFFERKDISMRGLFLIRTFTTNRNAIVCGEKYIIEDFNLSGPRYWGVFDISK